MMAKKPADSGAPKCPTCNGEKKVYDENWDRVTCPSCKGSGKG